MYLEKLTIQGFKSFANEAELVFTRRLTAIVGPNGSGKSNIADAVRWVLGEQSPKLLRGKKADDVIFSGSEKKSRLSFAQVDLHLDNADHQAPIDYTKIIVSRKIYRNGESEYLLNNNKVRLSDIQLLLAKSHFGQKTYSVIGQGTIDRLLTISSSERKDFFDEATGVKQYQIKKDQAINKLQHTHENLLQAENVLNEILPRLRSLKRQVNKLEAKEKLESELHQLQTNFYSFLTDRLQTDLDKVKDAKAKQQEKIDKVQAQLNELQKKLESQSAGSSRSADFDLLQKKLAALQDEYNLLSREKTKLEGARDLDMIKSGQGDLVWLQSSLDNLATKENKLKIQLTEKQQETKQTETELKQLEIQERDIQTKLKQTENLWQEHLQPTADWDQLEKQADSLRQEYRVIDQELESINNLEGWQIFKTKLKTFGQKVYGFLKAVKKPEQLDQSKMMAELKKLLEQKDQSSTAIHKLKTSQELIQQNISSLEHQLQEIVQEKNKLQEEIKLNNSGKPTTGNNLTDINNRLQTQAQTIEKVSLEIAEFNNKEEGKKQQILDWQKDYSRLQYDLNLLSNQLNNLNIELAKLETRWEDLQREIRDEFPTFTASKVVSLDPGETKHKILDIKRQLSIIGGIDDATLQEYQEVKERADFLEQQTTDLNQAMQSLKKLIKELDETIAQQFNDSFKNINTLFSKYFKKLFDGGSAKLLLEMKQPEDRPEGDRPLGGELGEDSDGDDEEDVEKQKSNKLHFDSLDYNIEIIATPPGKKVSGINMLSGGEKALTSIALISAIIANNPSPFVVLDEVDAALDESNSIRFAEIVDELSDKTQFITITHNRATMHQAKILYGVTMGEDGVSHLLSVNFEEADKLAT